MTNSRVPASANADYVASVQTAKPIKYITEEKIKSSRFKVTIVLLLAQVYDLWITFKVLSMEGYEMNPAARLLIGLGLIIPFKLGAALIALWKVKYGKPSKYKFNNLPELPAFGVSSFVLGIYTLVVVLNTLTYFQYVP